MVDWRVAFSDRAWAESWIRQQRPFAEPVTPHLLAALSPRAGERVVDIGTGAGPIALAAARAVHPGGEIVAIDISETLVQYVSRRASEAGIEGLTVVLADFETAALPGVPFDAATSQMGVMFFANPEAAFGNIRRYLRPEGRYVFACWAEPAANPLHPEVLAGAVAGVPAETGTGAFSLSDADATLLMLASAGFRDMSVNRLNLEVRVDRDTVLDPYLIETVVGEGGRVALSELHRQVDAFAMPDGEVRVPLGVLLYRAFNQT